MLTNDSRCQNCGGKLIQINEIKSVCEYCESVFVKAPPPLSQQNNVAEVERMEDYFYMVVSNKTKINPVLSAQYRKKLLELKPESVFLMFTQKGEPVTKFENIYDQIKTEKEFYYCVSIWLSNVMCILNNSKRWDFHYLSRCKRAQHELFTEYLYRDTEVITVLKGIKNSEFINVEEVQEMLVIFYNFIVKDTDEDRKTDNNFLSELFKTLFELFTDETFKKNPTISLDNLQTQQETNNIVNEEPTTVVNQQSTNVVDKPPENTVKQQIKSETNSKYEIYKKKFDFFEDN